MRSDYAFIETDTTALVTAMIAAYEKMTGVTVQPASPERLFILWVADIIVQTRVAINYAANQNIPSRAVGEIWMRWQNSFTRSCDPRPRLQLARCASPYRKRRNLPF